MEAELGLLLMLLGVCNGVETYCDGRQNGTQCYGVLGGTVVLRLVDNASLIPGYNWEKEKSLILKWRKNMILLNTLENRTLFIPSNGTFRINNLGKNDSGEYILETFDSDNKFTRRQTLQLTVQGYKSMPVIAGILSTLLIIFAVGVAVIWAHRKKQYNQEEEGELTYADVRMVQRQERKVNQRVEGEVEYGQVKFSEQPQKTEPVRDNFLLH